MSESELVSVPFTTTGTSLLNPTCTYNVSGEIGELISFQSWTLETASTVGIGEINSGFAYMVWNPHLSNQKNRVESAV